MRPTWWPRLTILTLLALPLRADDYEDQSTLPYCVREVTSQTGP